MRLLVTIICFFSITSTYADAWEDVTYEQAFKIQKLLKKSKFILDYCDCCSENYVYLMKVIKTEIVTCSYNSSKYSVKTQSVRIGKFAQDEGRTDVRTSVEFDYEEPRLVDYTISMNYTFGHKKKNNACIPIGRLIGYDFGDKPLCNGIGVYPNPFKVGVEIFDDDYKKWARKKLKYN